MVWPWIYSLFFFYSTYCSSRHTHSPNEFNPSCFKLQFYSIYFIEFYRLCYLYNSIYFILFIYFYILYTLFYILFYVLLYVLQQGSQGMQSGHAYRFYYGQWWACYAMEGNMGPLKGIQAPGSRQSLVGMLISCFWIFWFFFQKN